MADNNIRTSIVLMAHSPAAGRMVETDHGTFLTKEDALERGRGVFRTLKWQVAKKTVLFREEGEPSVSFVPLTEVFSRGEEED